MNRIMGLGLAGVAAVAVAAAVPAFAQSDYPNQPVTLVVAFSPGGATDTLARLIHNELGEALGQPVVVENRPGAGGFVAWRSLAQGEADGYTILLGENAVAMNSALRAAEGFDPREAFDAVARVALAPMAAVVNENVPVETLEEWIQYSQENEVSYSSSGVGSVSHLIHEAFAEAVGLRMEHIPYGGGGEATAAVASGHVESIFSSVGAGARLVEESNAKAMIVTSDERNPRLDAPTAKELGIETDVELRFWWGLFVPAGTPEPVKERIQQAVERILEDPALVERMANAEYDPAFLPAGGMGELLDSEYTNWRTFIEERGIVPQ